MVAGKPEMLEGSAVRPQLCSRHRLRPEALPAEQLAHELDGCAFIPSALNKDFENLALIIDRAPQVHMLAGDPDDHLVEMPAIARPRTAAPPIRTLLSTIPDQAVWASSQWTQRWRKADSNSRSHQRANTGTDRYRAA